MNEVIVNIQTIVKSYGYITQTKHKPSQGIRINGHIIGKTEIRAFDLSISLDKNVRALICQLPLATDNHVVVENHIVAAIEY